MPLEIGLAAHRRVRLDQQLGEYLEAAFAFVIAADHGMNAKHNADGAPRVHYLIGLASQSWTTAVGGGAAGSDR